MTTTINASTVSGLIQTADTSGSLALQTASTTALTLDTSQNATFAGSVKTNTLTSAASTALTLQSAGTTAVTIPTTGNVLIGTTTDPAYSGFTTLAVNSATGALIDMQRAGTRIGSLQTNSTDELRLYASSGVFTSYYAGGSERMRIDSSGKVGIGTTSPTGILNVKGTGGDALPATSGSTQSAGLVTRLQQGGGIGSVMDIGGNGGTGSWIQVTEPSNLATNYPLLLNPNGGSVLAGTTTQTPGYGNTSTGAQLSNNGSHFSRAATDWVQTVNQNTADGSARYLIGFRVSNSQVGNIQSNGSNCTYNSTSDYRLKKDVVPMVGALDRVSQLKPVTYKWKLDNSVGEGFIAHELQAVVPECVTGEKDAVDSDGNPDYQGIDTSFLVATLTAAIQELKAINDTQAETINALTARIVALEGA